MTLHLYIKAIKESNKYVAALYDNTPNSINHTWVPDLDLTTRKTEALLMAIYDALGYLTGKGITNCELLIQDSTVCDWLHGDNRNNRYLELLEEIEFLCDDFLSLTINTIDDKNNYAKKLATLEQFNKLQDKTLSDLSIFEDK